MSSKAQILITDSKLQNNRTVRILFFGVYTTNLCTTLIKACVDIVLYYCLSVFDHFVGLALKGLKRPF